MFRYFKKSLIVFSLILFIFIIVACEGRKYTPMPEYVLNPDGLSYKLNHYRGEEAHVVIAKEFKGMPVTIIGSNAFLSNTVVETVVISNKIVKIETYAFRETTNLREVIFEENSELLIMEGGIFEWNDKITTITLPKSVTNIDETTFQMVNSLESINVEVGNLVYSSHDGILFNKDQTELLKYPEGKLGNTYEIPASVTRIGNASFNLQYHLETITFHPNSLVTSIGKRAFAASSIEAFPIPKTVTSIEDGAFSIMHNYNSFTVEDNSMLESMGHLVFESNFLTTINLPESLKNIKNNTFTDSTNLLAINVDENNQHFKSVNGILFSKLGNKLYHVPEAMNLTSYVVPKEVTEISDFAFSRVYSLTEVTFEEGRE